MGPLECFLRLKSLGLWMLGIEFLSFGFWVLEASGGLWRSLEAPMDAGFCRSGLEPSGGLCRPLKAFGPLQAGALHSRTPNAKNY